MKEKKEVFVLHLPNIENDDVIKLSEQLILQTKKMIDGFRIETDKIIMDIVIKKD